MIFTEDELSLAIKEQHERVQGGGSLAPLLPFVFRLHNKPYSLDWSHFMFEPFFKVRNMPRKMIFLCARQVSKSTSQAAAQILRAYSQPFFNILTVMPFYEHVRKFSSNYVRPFIVGSPIRARLSGSLEDSVLQRTLRNYSTLFYSYSQGDPTRTRGVPASECDFDECLTGDTLITLADGSTVRLLDLEPGDELLSFKEDLTISHSTVIQLIPRGKRAVWRLRLSNNETLECTDNERIYTNVGWLYLSEMWSKDTHGSADAADGDTEAAYPGNSAGRRLTEKGPRRISDLRQLGVYHRSREGIRSSAIESIEYIGEEDVFDIEVDGDHTFFANNIAVHNCQDLDVSDIPIIEQTMGASPFKIVRYTGTPKTRDNTAHILWSDSSQAHWHIPCGCGKTNRCTSSADLLKMLGDRTLVCAGCGQPANSRRGFWVHDFPDRQLIFAGYHVPQPILPMHYEVPSNWYVILDYMKNKPRYAFMNEVLGESYDVGAKLITEDEVREACVVTPVTPDEMRAMSHEYIMTALGVDWGGRGKEKPSDSEEFVSNTAMALAGLTNDGHVDVRWLHKVPYVVDSADEPKMAANVAGQACCNWLAMDYGGQGNVQENIIKALGWPAQNICPFTYSVMAPTKPIVFYSPPQRGGCRSSYTLDKPRSLLLLCELIKRGIVRLPANEKWLRDHLRDFLNIYEESVDNPRGSPTRLVKRALRKTDDIVHAINFAVMALFHATRAWPKIAEAFIEAT